MGIAIVFIAALPAAYLAGLIALLLGTGWLMSLAVLIGTGVLSALVIALAAVCRGLVRRDQVQGEVA